ncbi:hypothetical protein P9273_03825 [Mesorhizobium sp. WSM4935]|uniref:hypothetical protein n=1 Tax=Mesorhizobium sp. WSM4935 TaxID=3038547 RepID=UPI0024156380|nr:hypothetical protein [Mesorhizobium sp. WSM4935]MDG4874227.1 hypothetical protein [Mesorhizobium sp. WSM4935]
MSFPFKLPEITYPLVIDTVGKTLAMGEEISVHCHTYGCGHTGRLNLVSIARRRGMNYSSGEAALREVIYCPRCREAGRNDKNVGFIHHTLADPFSKWPRQRNDYAKAKGE